MAVISAAVAAVAAVATATTVASVATAVATAVVAVSVAIGTLGLAVTAVGMVTGNKDLLKAGKIMGYVGLAGGLAGGAIGGFGAMANGTGSFLEGAAGAYSGASQHLSEAWDKGVGSWFSSDTAGGVVGQAGGQNPAFTQATGAKPGIGMSPSTSMTAQPAEQALDAGQTATTLGQNGAIPTTAPTNVNPAEASYSSQVASASAAPKAPVGAMAPSVDQAISQSQGEIAKTIAGGPLGNAATTGSPIVDAASKAKNAWDDMPDYLKYSMLTTGGQGVAGLASGYFAGASAEEKLEFDKLVNQQRQDQVNLQNKNASYVPRVRFNGPTGPAGLLNMAGGG